MVARLTGETKAEAVRRGGLPVRDHRPADEILGCDSDGVPR